jgi:hypothetical protein
MDHTQAESHKEVTVTDRTTQEDRIGGEAGASSFWELVVYIVIAMVLLGIGVVLSEGFKQLAGLFRRIVGD